MQVCSTEYKNKIFFYVPQNAVYQPGGIPVQLEDIERFA